MEESVAIDTPRIPRLVRYFISGGTGAVVNIGTLFLLTHFGGVWYVTSATLAFLTAFLVSFTLQRTWTFELRGTGQLARHTSLYFIVALFNTALNALFVYGLVEYLGVWYLLAQLISGIILAIGSFFLYRKIFV